MAISPTKYVDITSGVGGESSVSTRDLMARLITTSDSQEEGTVSEYDLAGVLSTFGSDSEEYAFAAKYFSFVSKSIKMADTISIAQRYEDITDTSDTPVETMTRIDNLSDNFGSFYFMDTLTNAEIATVAAWNSSMNYKYMYNVDVASDNASDLAALVDGISGTHLTLDDGEYSSFMPMVLFATTDYDGVNTVKNYMFQLFDDETPTVTTDDDSDTYDALKINYLGQTQKSGSGISVYQDGYNMDGVDAGPYCNEIWLKDAIGTELLNLLLAVEMIPANSTGEALGANAIQTIIDAALLNGTFLIDKDLTSTQKAYITSVTGDEDAYVAVGSQGYWLDVSIDSETEDDVTQYIMSYTLIYAKADSVRKIEGTNILI